MSETETTESEAIQELRAKADEAARLQRETVIKDREIAFLRAGIPTESKPAQAFLREYDGELEPTKIKEAAVEWGLWKPEGSDPEPDPTAEDREKLRQGGNPTDQLPPVGDRMVKAHEEFREMRAAGARREEAAVTVIGALVKGGIEGDERVVIQPGGLQRSYDFRDVPYQDGKARS